MDAVDYEAFGKFAVAVAKLVDSRGQVGAADSGDLLLAAFKQGLSVEQTADLIVGGATKH